MLAYIWGYTQHRILCLMFLLLLYLTLSLVWSLIEFVVLDALFQMRLLPAMNVAVELESGVRVSLWGSDSETRIQLLLFWVFSVRLTMIGLRVSLQLVGISSLRNGFEWVTIRIITIWNQSLELKLLPGTCVMLSFIVRSLGFDTWGWAILHLDLLRHHSFVTGTRGFLGILLSLHRLCRNWRLFT